MAKGNPRTPRQSLDEGVMGGAARRLIAAQRIIAVTTVAAVTHGDSPRLAHCASHRWLTVVTAVTRGSSW